jgi:hypothetical protein
VANVTIDIADPPYPTAPMPTSSFVLRAPTWARLNVTEGFTITPQLACAGMDRCAVTAGRLTATAVIQSMTIDNTVLDTPDNYSGARFKLVAASGAVATGSATRGTMTFSQATAVRESFVLYVTTTAVIQQVVTRRNDDGTTTVVDTSPMGVLVTSGTRSFGVVGVTR